MGSNKITVFEHSQLYVGERGFKEAHFNALIKYNDFHGSKYFTTGYKKIIFKSYVGVIQVGDRVIEILPKADSLPAADAKTKDKWHRALLYMLKKAGYIKLNQTEKAAQETKKVDLLDIYLYTYLKEVEQILHSGLVKKYRRIHQNRASLKGRLLIGKQIAHNSIHKERLYTEHSIYDSNNIFNAILKRALEIIYVSSTNNTLKQTASQHLLSFENINSWQGDAAAFDKLNFDRKTMAYTYAIELARMIILNYNPDMSSGRKAVLAILFDMDRLFERFVYRMLKAEEKNYKENKLSIRPQTTLPFWQDKSIRADIIIDFITVQEKQTFIHKFVVDSKWKIISSNDPADDDLKQMFTYNFQYGSNNSILFYPSIGQRNSGFSKYHKSIIVPGFKHGCALYFCNMFNAFGFLSDAFSKQFLGYVFAEAIKEAETGQMVK